MGVFRPKKRVEIENMFPNPFFIKSRHGGGRCRHTFAGFYKNKDGMGWDEIVNGIGWDGVKSKKFWDGMG